MKVQKITRKSDPTDIRNALKIKTPHELKAELGFKELHDFRRWCKVRKIEVPKYASKLKRV